MKKNLIPFFLVLFTFTLILAAPTAASAFSVTVNQTEVPYSSATGYPYDAGGTPMIPVQQTMTYYGAICATDPHTGDTVLNLGVNEIRVFDNQAKIAVNGNLVATGAAAVKKNGVLYAPAKEIITGLGGYYAYNGAKLEIATQTQDHAVYMLEKKKKARDIWGTWATANDQKNAGNYRAAIPNYEISVPGMLAEKNDLGLALCYQRLAICYARTGSYDKAAASFQRSSYYWNICGDDQTALITHKCDKNIREEIRLFWKTEDGARSVATAHRVNYEPERGVVLGYTSDATNTYPSTSAKQAGMWLTYAQYTDDVGPGTAIDRKIQSVADDTVIELAIEPGKGWSSLSDETTKNWALYLHNCGKKVMVRFANEMNDSSNGWYTSNYDTYKNGYIRFAKVFRQYAPEIPLIWAPNFFPENVVDHYYPGDDYVDYVGISSYIFSRTLTAAEIQANYDILGTGKRLDRWSQQIDFLYNRYAYKKPILISEGAVSYVDKNAGAQIVNEAAYQIGDMYTYLPIRYANLKYAVYFNIDKENKKEQYRLSDHAELLNAYNGAIQSDSFLSDFRQTAPFSYVPLEGLTERDLLPDTKQTLCAYVKYGDDSAVRSVRYSVNGTAVGTAAAPPYEITCDLKPYAGQRINIKAEILDKNGKVLTSKVFRVTVEGFSDVPAKAYFCDAVQWAVDQKITEGTSKTTFSPKNDCTRGQVVTFLWRAAGSPEPVTAENPFSDIAPKNYYYKAVLWAAENEITKGTSATAFSPNKTCSRGEIVTFLWRAAGSPQDGSGTENPFSDVRADKFYYQSVLWAVNRGVTKGSTASTFDPEKTCTRAEVVTFIYRDRK